MNSRRWLWLTALVFAVGGVVLVWRSYGVHWVEPHPGFVDSSEQSVDLRYDLKLMWETKRLAGFPVLRASTDRAINAASRVFETVSLAGKSREEVIAAIGDPKASNDSIYNFPFWPAAKDSMVYRFDCGSYGWQFNLFFDEAGKVFEVERHWIH